MKTITFANVPDQMVTDYIAWFGTAAAAKDYIRSLITADYNKRKSDAADAAAVAARVAPTPVDPVTITTTIA